MRNIPDTMNILNEAASRFPDATSFLAGRPPDESVDCRVTRTWIEQFTANINTPNIWRKLGQYSDTSGIVLDLLAQYFISCGQGATCAQDCMVTNGAQEGMIIALMGICDGTGVALTADPSYAGFIGAAHVAGVHIQTVLDGPDFVTRLVERMSITSPKVNCVYLIPDFANPTGKILSLEERVLIVKAAHTTNTVIIEDCAYRYYRYEGTALPTLYSLSGGDHVILLESFAKTLLPGLRIGALVTRSRDSNGCSLMKTFSRIKSYISVCTSPIVQAALGGFLLSDGRHMPRWMEPKVQRLKDRRDVLLKALGNEFVGRDRVSWNRPRGGFFTCVQLGIPFGLQECFRCAAEARVLVLPMRLFSTDDHWREDIRLSYSNVSPCQIEPSLARFARWMLKLGIKGIG